MENSGNMYSPNVLPKTLLFSKQNGKAAFFHMFSYRLIITDQVQLDPNSLLKATFQGKRQSLQL